jgi:hypothetical protein
MSAIRPVFVALAVVLILPPVVRAQAVGGPGAIAGTVVDVNGEPMAGVQVSVVGMRTGAFTGGRGQFLLPAVEAGPRQLVARRTGYRPDTVRVELEPGDRPAVWMVLERFVVELAAVDVRATAHIAARLVDFEQRRRQSIGGRFVGPEEIEAQAPTETSDLLRRVLGVHMVDSSHVLVPVSNRGLKLVPLPTGGVAAVQCVMRIALDGFLMDSNFSMNMISPKSIHGIEIYNGPSSIPPQLNAVGTDLTCGLIVIWTKSG